MHIAIAVEAPKHFLFLEMLARRMLPFRASQWNQNPRQRICRKCLELPTILLKSAENRMLIDKKV
jgi:hypothetical protein